MISNKTIPMVWSMPLSQVSNDPNQLEPNDQNTPGRQDTSLSSGLVVYLMHCVSCLPEVFFSASCCLRKGGTGNQGTCLNEENNRITSIDQTQLSVRGWWVNNPEVLKNGIIFLRIIDIYLNKCCFYWRGTCKEAEFKSEVLTPAQSIKGFRGHLSCASHCPVGC